MMKNNVGQRKSKVKRTIEHRSTRAPEHKTCALVPCALVHFCILSFLSLYAQQGAKYLIISHDNFIGAIQPLKDWKTKKGIKALAVPLSQIGSTPAQIKSYIVNAYNTWQPRPEYILLVGSGNFLPSYNNRYDDYYGDMTGDYKMELAVGRFPCNTPAQCSIMVAKTLAYERTPYVTDTTWYKKGTTVIREDTPPDSFYQPDARYVRDIWKNAGFTTIDSFIGPPPYGNNNATDVINSINDGRNFVVYRGQGVGNWWSPFAVNPAQVNNGFRLPVIVSLSCAMMTFVPGESMVGEAWLRTGTVNAPKGAVAFFGTTVTGSHISRYRGTVTKGFFKALFDEKLSNLGEVTKRAKFILDSLYHIQVRYQECNLYGDPELPLFTTTPKTLSVFYDTVVFIQPTNFTVTIRQSGNPLPQALVCIKMDTTIYQSGYTDGQGRITFNFTPTEIGFLEITVSAKNSIPFEGQARVIAGDAPYVTFHHSLIRDDLGGNNNSRINPGETIGLKIFLRNSGTLTAEQVTGRLRTSDRLITITDSIGSFGNILPESIVGSIEDFQFTVASSCTNNHRISFSLAAFDTLSHEWLSSFELMVSAPKIIYEQSLFSDSPPGGNGNFWLEPAEAGKLFLTIKNDGSETLFDVRAVLFSQSQYVYTTDSLSSFGNVPISGIVTNLSDYFAISLSNFLPKDYDLPFSIRLSGDAGTFNYTDTITWTIRTAPWNTSDPTGPDEYGYYCYDDTDTLSGRAPTYSWFGIAPPGPGVIIPQITNSDAAVVTIPLPFRFRYYGQNYDSISVCSNGFMAMGRTDYRFGNNRQIPDTIGPRAMLSPFWDDLNPDENTNFGHGDIYQYYDTLNHRFIIEFKEVAHYTQSSQWETFQAVLLDPAYYPTGTGDGEILFLYNTLANPRENTVGIENYTENIGIQYLYNNSYPSSAAPLVNSRALRFTTLTPASQKKPWLNLVSIFLNDSLGNNNGIPEPGETIILVTTLLNRGDTTGFQIYGFLRNLDSDALVLDSSGYFGDIPVFGQRSNSLDPHIFQISTTPQDTILNFVLNIYGQGYYTSQFFSIGLGSYTGITENSEFGIRNSELKIYPNPFTGSTVIRQPSAVNRPPFSAILIYDINGRLVKSFSAVDGKRITEHGIIWDGKDKDGIPVNPGVYFVVSETKEKEKLKLKLVRIH